MLTLLIVFIIAFSISMCNFYEDLEDILLSLCNGLLATLIIGLPLSFALPMKTYQKQTSLSIQALQDNNTIKGSFFLGCSQIDGDMKYVFYYGENGLYRMMQIKTNNAQIKYSDNTPKVTIIEITPTKDLINYFAIDGDIGDKSYIIEVPNGTIKNNFTLDAN